MLAQCIDNVYVSTKMCICVWLVWVLLGIDITQLVSKLLELLVTITNESNAIMLYAMRNKAVLYSSN